MTFTFLDFDRIYGKELDLHLYKTIPGNSEKDWIPAYHFDITLHGESYSIGKIDIRIGHNQQLYYGGHIGYEIYSKYRGHHYEGKAVQLIAQVARAHQMGAVLITCNPDNMASRKTCEYIGATLLEMVDLPPENDMYQRGEKQKCIYSYSLEAT
ncbi:GNAT family N-acetyltransferase [Gracilibacillus timonensis]|uniref:GNAT family N-acetyltransferase n=1 Tax=Gracilibacillus timonensis TaxID=1816696 RepID=UPI000826E8AE|nr:GNAT family N-acetyltransferase [Gracilibacillus timonensis]